MSIHVYKGRTASLQFTFYTIDTSLMPVSLHEQLIARLAPHADPETAVVLVGDLVRLGGRPDALPAVLALLDELAEVSGKVSVCAQEMFPELKRRQVLDAAVPWLDLGIALAESSGAVAMKYFKESPLILGLMEASSVRHTVLSQALELAESDA